MKDELGNIVTDSVVRKEVWRKHVDKLLNVENIWDGEVECHAVEGSSCYISEEDVRRALKHTKMGKVVGPSCVESEMMRASGDMGVGWLTELSNCIVAEGSIPDDWKSSALVLY